MHHLLFGRLWSRSVSTPIRAVSQDKEKLNPILWSWLVKHRIHISEAISLISMINTRISSSNLQTIQPLVAMETFPNFHPPTKYNQITLEDQQWFLSRHGTAGPLDLDIGGPFPKTGGPADLDVDCDGDRWWTWIPWKPCSPFICTIGYTPEV